jgi:hypothetical protein
MYCKQRQFKARDAAQSPTQLINAREMQHKSEKAAKRQRKQFNLAKAFRVSRSILSLQKQFKAVKIAFKAAHMPAKAAQCCNKFFKVPAKEKPLSTPAKCSFKSAESSENISSLRNAASSRRKAARVIQVSEMQLQARAIQICGMQLKSVKAA